MSIQDLSQEIVKFEKDLLDFAFNLTRERSDASDLYQDTVYRAIKNRHLFKENNNLRAWLMTIMRNLFINAYRKKRRRQIFQDGSTNNYLINSTNATVGNLGEVKINYEELISLVNRLDDGLRIPFMLAYQGFKYQDIADEMDIPLGTVKSRLFIARKKIQTAIRHHYAIFRDELSAA